jgi:hypothetical protein
MEKDVKRFVRIHKIGVLEYWSNGVMENPNTSILHFVDSLLTLSAIGDTLSSAAPFICLHFGIAV